MPLIVGPPEAIDCRTPGLSYRCRKELKRLARGAGLLVVGLLFMSMFLLVGCGRSSPAAPIEQPTSSPPPGSTPTPADTLSVPASASVAPAAAGEQGGERPLAARINGVPIYLDVYEKQVAQTEEALAEQGLLLEGEEGQAQRTQIRQNVLNALVEQAIIEGAAAEMGVVVTDEEVERSVQESIALGQGQQAFEKWLAANNLTLEEFRATQRSQLLASKMIERVTTRVPTTAEQVHARHILVSDPEKAQFILQQLKNDMNFAALAQQASEDVSSAANGGDLGWFPRDVPLMPPAVVEAAFALNPGEVSDVVKSDQGYHIIEVEAREANRPLAPDILLYIRQRAFEEWMAEKEGQATIERYVDM